MDNAIVFTGLPRMPDRFEQSVTEMRELEERGLIDHILFVTWRGELEGTPRFAKILNDAGIEVIEKRSSPVGGQGNIWHQMRALDYGLRALPSECRVLKTRTDTHIEQSFLARLLSGNIEYIHTSAGSDVFEERIWVPYASGQDPYYICDYCFYGRKPDMERLVHYDIRYKILFDLPFGGNPEQRRFIHPYLLKYPFLESYLKYDRSGFVLDRRALVESRADSPIYAAFYAFYFKSLMADFYVESDPVSFKHRNKVPNDSVGANLGFEEKLFSHLERGDSVHWWHNMDWLESQFADPQNQQVPKHILKGTERSFDEWREYEIPREALLADIERDKKYFDYRINPHHPLTNWIVNQILEPLRLLDPVKQLLRNVLNRD